MPALLIQDRHQGNFLLSRCFSSEKGAAASVEKAVVWNGFACSVVPFPDVYETILVSFGISRMIPIGRGCTVRRKSVAAGAPVMRLPRLAAIHKPATARCGGASRWENTYV